MDWQNDISEFLHVDRFVVRGSINYCRIIASTRLGYPVGSVGIHALSCWEIYDHYSCI